ncbi:hypothetical protein AcW1_009496 [Taiwanofungus camphoratus]|nr:hypothetical protein AcW1_009496 [Antrodia cinnamomea]
MRRGSRWLRPLATADRTNTAKRDHSFSLGSSHLSAPAVRGTTLAELSTVFCKSAPGFSPSPSPPHTLLQDSLGELGEWQLGAARLISAPGGVRRSDRVGADKSSLRGGVSPSTLNCKPAGALRGVGHLGRRQERTEAPVAAACLGILLLGPYLHTTASALLVTLQTALALSCERVPVRCHVYCTVQ